MTAVSDVVVTVTPEAAALVAELGYQREFEQMLGHALGTIAHLKRVEVTRYDDHCDPYEPRVVLEVWVDEPFLERDQVGWDWGAWFGATFSGQVGMRFGFGVNYREDDEG